MVTHGCSCVPISWLDWNTISLCGGTMPETMSAFPRPAFLQTYLEHDVAGLRWQVLLPSSFHAR